MERGALHASLVVALTLHVCGCGGGGGDDGPATVTPDTAIVDDASPGLDDTSFADDSGAPIDSPSPSPVDSAEPVDSATPSVDSGTPSSDTGAPPTDTGGPTTQPAVPRNPTSLFAYLKAGSYKSFKHESAPHASAGPHGTVQVYINDVLDKSLASGSGQHPEGAASVKELWSGTSLFGWAVMVKTAPTSEGGKNWYWFELFNTTDPSKALEGNGLPGCTGCHSLGRDYYRSSYPLK